MISYYEETRRKYKPEEIRTLLIAEAPPKTDSGRFFYFKDVKDKDSLFLETMKVLYPDLFTSTKEVREMKPDFLKQFSNDGFYLIDASEVPMEDTTPRIKIRQLREHLPSLMDKVRNLVDKETKIILISATVYKVCFEPLKNAGLNVLNEGSIDFPGLGRQKLFREKLGSVLKAHGINNC